MLRQRVLGSLPCRSTPAIIRAIHTTSNGRWATRMVARRPSTARPQLRSGGPPFRVLATLEHPKPSITQRSRSVRALVKCFAWLGFAGLSISGAVVVFFIYDASTYKEDVDKYDVGISEIALNPRRGGPKNLPIAEVLVGTPPRGNCRARIKLTEN
jgi:hypothetical protein